MCHFINYNTPDSKIHMNINSFDIYPTSALVMLSVYKPGMAIPFIGKWIFDLIFSLKTVQLNSQRSTIR